MLVGIFWFIAAFVVLLALAALTGSWLRASASEAQTPAWAGFFTGEDYEHFISQLRQGLERAGLRSSIQNGVVSILSQTSARQVPLMTFAEACRGNQPCDWNRLLRDKLASVIADDQQVDLKDFDRVKDFLRLQLGAAAGLPNDMMVGREDLPGVATILVLDLPGAVRTISPHEAVPWNQPVAELMRIALDHIRGMSAPAIEEIQLDERVSAFVMSGEHSFVASNALLLGEFPKLVGTSGALIAVPTRNILLSYPIVSRAAGDAIFPMAWVASRRWREGPNSITPRLYWYRSGRFVHLPYEFTAERFTLHPPREFAMMLESLRGNYR